MEGHERDPFQQGPIGDPGEHPGEAEYAEVTDRLQARYPDRRRVGWAAALVASAELVFPNIRLRGVTPDPDDEMFLEYAVAGEAHFLVTGDKRHLQGLEKVRGVRIVSPAAFLAVLLEQDGDCPTS